MSRREHAPKKSDQHEQRRSVRRLVTSVTEGASALYSSQGTHRRAPPDPDQGRRRRADVHCGASYRQNVAPTRAAANIRTHIPNLDPKAALTVARRSGGVVTADPAVRVQPGLPGLSLYGSPAHTAITAVHRVALHGGQ